MASDDVPGLDLTPDELTQRLVENSDKSQPKTLLDGYLAESSAPGIVRLYCAPDLSSYVEIAAEDVLHREKLPASERSPEASRLWVNSHARVTRNRSSVEELQARYLTGSVTAEGMASAVASQPIASGLRFSPSEPTWQQSMNQHIPACNTAPGHSPCNGATFDWAGICGGTQRFICGPPPETTRLSCQGQSVRGGPACNW